MNAFTPKIDAHLDLALKTQRMHNAWVRLAASMQKVQRALEEQKKAIETFKCTNQKLGSQMNELGTNCRSYRTRLDRLEKTVTPLRDKSLRLAKIMDNYLEGKPNEAFMEEKKCA